MAQDVCIFTWEGCMYFYTGPCASMEQDVCIFIWDPAHPWRRMYAFLHGTLSLHGSGCMHFCMGPCASMEQDVYILHGTLSLHGSGCIHFYMGPCASMEQDVCIFTRDPAHPWSRMYAFLHRRMYAFLHRTLSLHGSGRMHFYTGP